MALDFTEFFSRYEALRAKADAAFARVKDASGLVTCQPGCSDCCHALFDLSLIEALYVNRRFNELFQGNDRAAILDRADLADRETYRIKRQAFRMSQEGVDASAILEEMAKARVRCPLLADDDSCLMYEHRPITCRLYGAPTAIEGEPRVCPKSGFTPGASYPTIQIDRIQDELFHIGADLMASFPTRHVAMADVLAPLSMVLMNEYDDNYMGLMTEEEVAELAAKQAAFGMNMGGCAPEQCASCAKAEDGKPSAGCSGGCSGNAYSVALGQDED